MIGGLSEGNVQLSIAAITDVTSEKTRGKSLALVGIAFASAFTIGPSLGAYFASRSFGLGAGVEIFGRKLNSYAVPALLTIILLTVETMYLYFCLPETRWLKLVEEVEETKEEKKVVAAVNTRTVKEVSI